MTPATQGKIESMLTNKPANPLRWKSLKLGRYASRLLLVAEFAGLKLDIVAITVLPDPTACPELPDMFRSSSDVVPRLT